MNFSKEYLEFEAFHIRELEELWQMTNDEELRHVIISARKVLEKIFESQHKESE